MSLKTLRISGFRCLNQVQLELDPRLNVLVGENGAGKTSILEAIYLLGRGRSFRAPRAAACIQTGQDESTIFGVTEAAGREHRLGLQLGRQGQQIHIDGEAGARVSDLVSALPVQLIDPAVHELVQGGPGERRRFLDWGVFHVKHDFIVAWRRYRRALQQRNSALRSGSSASAIRAWDPELVMTAASVSQYREEYLSLFSPKMQVKLHEMIGKEVKMHYKPGWNEASDFAAALAGSLDRDRALGSTQVGPHRAELQLETDGELARHRLSRGQQKMLAAGLILAQCEFVAEDQAGRVTLLVDEPAAELDAKSLQHLTSGIAASGAQAIYTTLADGALPLGRAARAFHVKRGEAITLV